MTRPWNDWYHCNGNTYATWEHGDQRGYRERHGRRHVEGDYKHRPPPQRDERLRNHARKLLQHPPVILTKEQAEFAGDIMVNRLLEAGIELLSFALDDHHFHLVGRFPDHRPRYFIGLAKQKASYRLVKEHGLVAPVWAKRCRCLPIANRGHQVESVNYDIDHAKKGASFVWSFRDGVIVPGKTG